MDTFLPDGRLLLASQATRTSAPILSIRNVDGTSTPIGVPAGTTFAYVLDDPEAT